MKAIFTVGAFLFFVFNLALGQTNKKVTQGEPVSKNVFTRKVKKGGAVKEETAFDFDKGVKEFDLKNFKSAIEYFDKALIQDQFDADAIYNRGVSYYSLDDIDHACMDWKLASYLGEYYAQKNYILVCDASFDEIAFMNSGMLVPPIHHTVESDDGTIDTQPSYPGGEEALKSFIQKKLIIPDSLKREFLDSRIVVKFVIGKDGTVSHPMAVKSNSRLAEVGVRLALSMPKWKPALKKGLPVVSEYLYPIVNGNDTSRLADKLYNDGVKSFELGELSKALDLFSKTIRINDEDNDAHYMCGLCHLRLGDNTKACSDWNRNSLRSYYSVVELLNKHCNANISSDDIPTLNATNQTIYTIVEDMPSFPEGEVAMLNYIAKNIKYPILAKENNICGRVYVSFVIDKDGYVREPKVLRGIGGGCDEEALRIVKEMPQWTPGTQNGRPVNVQFNLPIKFGH